MPRSKSGTLTDLGLEKFLNRHYGEGFYARFEELLPNSDLYIAEKLSTPERPIIYQTVSNWRKKRMEERGNDR